MSSRAKKALLIGIDGFNLSRIDSVAAPTIRRLRATGPYAPGRIYPDDTTMTVSGPGWSTILTGTWPTRHRVLDNTIEGNDLAGHPDLFVRATGRRRFYVASWEPLYERILTPDVDHRHVIPGKHTPEMDVEVCEAAVRALGDATAGFDLGFVYYGSLDAAGHSYGATTPEYDAAIRAVDGHVARMLETIASRPTYAEEDWLIALTTDHGHRPEGGHGGQSEAERSTFVIWVGESLDGSAESTRMVDIAPTLLDHIGVRLDPAWNLDGRSVLVKEEQ